MKKFLILCVCFGLSVSVQAQKCGCEESFKWAKETFEKNDAGFSSIVEKKGNDAYILHNKIYEEKAAKSEAGTECSEVIAQWLRFFRDGHIGFRYLNSNQKVINIESVAFNENDFKKYISSKKVQDLEGIWTYSNYKLAIKKENDLFKAIVISSENKNWKTGEVKMSFDNKVGTIFSGNKSAIKVNSIKTFEDKYIKLDDEILEKVYPKVEVNKELDSYFSSLKSSKPLIELLDKETIYLRIPDFEISEKRFIDSLIQLHKKDILSTPNLIIDLRGNGGGSDASYSEIIPFLYTQPIRNLGAEFYSTTLNNERMLMLAENNDFDENSRKAFRKYYDKLESAKGEFVNLFDKSLSIIQKDTVYRFPENVGIIINQSNASTTEQFLLNAKQSKKVKLYGQTTYGALDISNVNQVKSPCGDYELYYGLSKSLRIPGFAVDDIGIQPDIFIDNSIDESKWVEFVKSNLK